MADSRKRVAVVGAGGLLGSALLASLPHDIVPITRKDGFPAVKRALSGADALIYLAQSADYRNPSFSKDLFQVNMALLRDVLEVAVESVSQVISFSSGSVYKNDGSLLTEDSPLDLDSVSPYVASKICGESIARAFSGSVESMSIVRPFFMYGRKQRPTMLFKSLASRILAGDEIVLGQDGGMRFNPVYVEDAVDFVATLLEREDQGVTTYNLCGPEVLTLDWCVREIGMLVNKEPTVSCSDDPCTSFVAGTKHSFFTPGTSVSQGLKKVFAE